MDRISRLRRHGWITYSILALLLLLLGGIYFSLLKDLPSPSRLKSTNLSKSTQIYDRNNVLLYTIYAEKNQSFVPLNHIPDSLQKATIAIEDKEFYRHGPIDFRGISRAFYSTFFARQLQGGSTLTQQLVKNSLLTQDRTIQRKLKEVILSFATELIYSKKQILEMYLNQVPYGGTSYGVQAAALTYFGKPVNDLTLAQSAFLAGLPEAPSTLSPFGTRPELGKRRQIEVLRKMREQNYITPTQEKQAGEEKLVFQKISNAIKAPHFVLYVKELLSQKYGSKMVETGGLRVKTSLDLALQEMAQAKVASEVAALKQNNVGNGAALITNPATGEILAMVGSKNYFDEKQGNTNITLAQLQPGSSIKPINYAVGLMKGYTAATPFIDQAMCFGGTPPYCPRNYDNRFRGAVQMRYALGNSLNIPAVEMLKLNGVNAMIATASAMGINSFTDPTRYGLSLTLGGGEVTMLEMATAFGVFANSGYRIDLHPVLKVTDSNNRVLEEYNPPPSPIFGKRVLPQGVAFIISNILMDNSARTETFGPSSALKINNQPVAVKTGTTNDYRDNWTIGYTLGPPYVVVTWVGNNDHTPMNGVVSGVTGAAPIWHTIMANLLKNKQAQVPKQPSDVIRKAICMPSGLIPPPDGTPDRCPVRLEYFIKGTEPKQLDPGKQKIFWDKVANSYAKPGQTENVEERQEIIITDPLGNRYCASCPRPSPTPKP